MKKNTLSDHEHPLQIIEKTTPSGEQKNICLYFYWYFYQNTHEYVTILRNKQENTSNEKLLISKK